MYENFFGLSSSPFKLSPDPFFLFSSEKNKDALASISDAISQRKGFAVMTGEVGTGKTLVLRCLVESLERDEIPFAYFIGPRLSTVDFLSYITFELGISVPENTKGTLLRALYGFLLAQYEKGLTTVLIIDEAHQMPRSVLEEIRLLTNFETAQQKLVQIVLVGQPELEKKLDSVELRSLKQRIAVRCQLEPLGAEEVCQYIERRLELAGADSQASTIFPAETVKAIYRYSLGIPRLVNSICDQALITACARQVRVVPVEVIKEVASLFRLDPASNLKPTEQPFSLANQMSSSVPDKLRLAAPALKIASVRPPSPDPALSHLNIANAAPAQLEAPGGPEAAHNNSLRGDPISHERKTEQEPIMKEEVPPKESVFLKAKAHQVTAFQPAIAQTGRPLPDVLPAAQFGEIGREARPFRIRRWWEPWLRLTLIIGVVVAVPVALATGVFMARHQKGAATMLHQTAMAPRQTMILPQETMRTAETLPVKQAIASMQPTGSSFPVLVNAGSVGPISPRTDGAALRPTGQLKLLTPPAKAGTDTLSKPVLKSLPPSASIEAPLITGMQTKELDLGSLDAAIAPLAQPRPSVATGSSPNAAALPTLALRTNVEAPLPVGGRIKEPRLLTSVVPQYPGIARQTHTEGDVAVEVVIDKAGSVSDAKVVSGPTALRQAARGAVRQWKYEPPVLDGQPISVQMTVMVRFRM